MKKAAPELEKAKQTKDRTLRNRNKRKYKRNKKASKQLRKTFDQSFVHGKNYAGQSSAPQVSSTANAMYESAVPSFVRLRHAQNVWIKTYQNVVKWQHQHQLNYWKHCTVRLRAENARLKRRLAVQDSEDEEEEAQQQQRQAAVERDAAEALLDEEFIAFMEVSARHRLERSRLKNESVH
ncbi:uncharacterized protein LOC129731438 isoform X2 [Wyeomyia smithii]|uniref:uncharacterized protein LOC129731438 isoform X2 n=1 Tax=Wyeomyia smithii TaxID=174621 RepID=UPI002467BD25|nr:uncharacterized protein LOC129731438 isoform X2 [Wyeomyia smithii]